MMISSSAPGARASADRSARRGAAGPTPRHVPAVGSALALQRLVGNRAASRVLARWTKHPDPEKKGVMVPDVVAAEFMRFNPPTNA
jgi:hypothetical protein